MPGEPINFVHRPLPEAGPEKKKVPTKSGLFLLFLIVLAVAGTVKYAESRRAAGTRDPLQYDPVTLEPKKPKSFFGKIGYFVFSRAGEHLPGERDGRINILLLGMGGPGHDGPYLTDTIMLASLNTQTKQVALVSVPRDLAVSIPGYGVYKVNHANSFGEEQSAGSGGALATRVMSDTLDLYIPYYVRLDFSAFEEIIDEVGGVKVNVERTFTDHMFPAPGGEYQTVSFTAGEQTMDGRTALTYARSRHGDNNEGSDFARARRQQKIILAMKEKVLSFGTLVNPVRLNNILDSLDKHLTTNLEFSEMVTLFRMARDWQTDKIISLVLDTSENGYLRESFSPAGAFLLQPKTGNFEEIDRALKNIFSGSVARADDTPRQERPRLPTSTVEIQNGTWNAGLAARVRKRLESAGFIIGEIGNTSEKPVAQSGIYRVSAGAATDVSRALVSELQIPERQTPPNFVTPTGTTDILVVLGSDFLD